MGYNDGLPLMGFIIKCKRTDIEEDNVFYLKVNAFQETEALYMAQEYVNNHLVDCVVVETEARYNKGFSGVIHN